MIGHWVSSGSVIFMGNSVIVCDRNIGQLVAFGDGLHIKLIYIHIIY